MQRAKERQKPELHETGTEPEFFVSHIARAEPAGDGCVRLYIAAERHGYLRLEYTVVTTTAGLASMARQALTIAADTHNLMIWAEELREQ